MTTTSGDMRSTVLRWRQAVDLDAGMMTRTKRQGDGSGMMTRCGMIKKDDEKLQERLGDDDKLWERLWNYDKLGEFSWI
jgi:hypothetical protein